MPARPGVPRTAWSPGRVNLIGEHTDYNEGLALPMAIDLGVEVRFEPGPSGSLVLTSDLEPEPVALGSPGPLPAWAALAGAVVSLAGPHSAGTIRVRSTLPAGAGLSSSAAFAVALMLALGSDAGPLEMARLCQAAEATLGVPVGLMDPLAVRSAVAGHAVLIDFSDLSTRPVAVPEDLAVVVVDSGVARRLSETPYARRRAECERAAESIGGPLGRATLSDLDAVDDPVARRRARHVVTEVARVRSFVEALERKDASRAGELMTASHRSLSADFEVSTPALDALVDELAAQPGVHGARLTGAGFGGCVVAVVDPETELETSLRWWRCAPSGGATVGEG